MSETDDAIVLANEVLDTPGRDPDDALSMISRQFLRTIERGRELERHLWSIVIAAGGVVRVPTGTLQRMYSSDDFKWNISEIQIDGVMEFMASFASAQHQIEEAGTADTGFPLAKPLA